MDRLNLGVIGCGGIAHQNHFPGIRMCPETELVGLCDPDANVLARAKSQTGVELAVSDYRELLNRDEIHAVVVATPNEVHFPIVMEAFERGKHVLCEKPISMNASEARRMAEAGDRAKVRHMTAFTYRFVPAMRYLVELIRRGDLGEPFHYRSARLQDWGTRGLGWRQVGKLAGTGELGDMLSHRIDFAHLLVGPMARLTARLRRFHEVRDSAPSDLDDWVAILAEFQSGATGVLESSKIASGRNESWRSLDYVEVNGSEASFVFRTGEWNVLQTGKVGGPGLAPLVIPKQYWRWPGSPRDPHVGDPLVTFRYDQMWEFVDAIRNERPCNPSFHEGAQVQAVMDAAVKSSETGAWISLPA